MSGSRQKIGRGDAATRRRGEKNREIAPSRGRVVEDRASETSISRASVSDSFIPASPRLRVSASLLQKGFTLLELMIVISIIIILAIIVLPQYQRTVLVARESVLKDDLFQMRKMIDQYAADKGKLPQSLDDLVAAGYIRELPVDPITEKREWNTTMGNDPGSSEGAQGVTDVHSTATDPSTDGTPYSEW